MTDSPKKEIRVRFAPSPTGPFHLGNARTALFNWLFARNQGGAFILRIEDTDVVRSEAKYEKDIIDGLKWLGLDWDEGPDIGGNYGPYRQSERGESHEKYLRQLLDEGKAYYCFCSKEDLEGDRQAMLAQGMPPKYGGRCRNLPKEEIRKRLDKNEPSVIRFKMPDVEGDFTDTVRGKIKFNSSLIGDIVIAKNLKSPLFNFAVVVDDYEMKISHVIRGEDHLSNTPKQILIQNALGFDEVKYAHLPIILSPDRSKLSKRNIETNLNDYRLDGYLPEAIFNLLALLGWHPEDDREILTKEELVKEFDLKRVQKAGAIFNTTKLDWFNSQYIKNADIDTLAETIKGFIPKEWSRDKNTLIKIISLEKERMKKLSEFRDLAEFFFSLPDYNPKLLIWSRPKPPSLTIENNNGTATENERIISNLKLVREEISKVKESDFTKGAVEANIMPLTDIWGRGDLLWPLRVALSGKEASPGPFEIMEILGKEETIKRIDIAIKKLA